MDVLIFGGTGVISRAIVAELFQRNNSVTIVTRGKSGRNVPCDAEWIQHDRHDFDGLSRLLSGRSFDAVIDAICFTAEEADQTVELFRDRADQILVLSSVAAYRRPYNTIPTREEWEVLWDNPEYAYGFNKALVEKRLMSFSADGVPITIVRPSLTFGDGSRNVGVLRQNYGILSRMQSGKPLVMFGDGTTPWSFSFAPDVARAVVALIGNRSAIGRAFHIASQERTLWRDLYIELGRIVNREPVFEYIPSLTLYRASPDLCSHLYFEKSFPGLFDDSNLRQIASDRWAQITLSAGLRAVVESWEKDGLQIDPERDMLEDRLVEASLHGTLEVVTAAHANP